ncbi:MAG TPA: alpha/beta hydrolase [Draconibacterium sp.]|nr:alpha/beta hydrolase [Draconibacterium sp.]
MNKIILILGLVISQMFNSFAQDTAVITKNIVYKKLGDKELSVDMFYTASSKQKNNNTAISLFHGGGWVFGDPSEFHEACRRYAKKGFITFSFQYRLSINDDGTYPHPGITPLESSKDARSAIRWLRENAADLKINPEKIVVGGQSAGGQLALATALLDSVNEISDNLETSPVPNALLLFSSNVNTLEPWIDMLLGERRNEIWSISPYHNLKKSMPPAIAFHGEEDNQVLPYIIGFFKSKMFELGNYYELYTYPGRKHYLGEGNEKYARYFDEEILEKTDAFLDKFGF